MVSTRRIQIHYRIPQLCRVSQTLGKVFAECHPRIHHTATKDSAKTCLPSIFYRAFGKDFAKCLVNPREKKGNGKLTVTTALPSVITERHLGKFICLPSAMAEALGKVPTFAECHGHGTRQTDKLCRVSHLRYSAKLCFAKCFNYVECIISCTR